jgi:3-oxoadipate enol-lactonase
MAYVRTRLGRLFYEEHGETREGKPAVVLLHGLLFDGGMWRDQLAPLAALGRVLVVDGPGHGKSEVPPRFSLDDHAAALVDALDALGAPRAVVCGLSWGGMVGMRLALREPSRVAGLALLDTSAEAEELVRRVRYRAFIAMHRRVGLPYGLFARQIAPLMFAPQTLAERPELALSTYRRINGFDREGVARAALAVVVERTSVLPQLGAIGVPTLVLSGSEDRATPPARAESIAKAIGGATLAIVQGAGHMSTLEAPSAVNAELVPFVRKLTV